jgi:hypothetical protein
MTKSICIAAAAAALLTACGGGEKSASVAAAAAKAGFNQASVCEFSNWRDGVSACKDGQLALFLPNSWGNERLPLLAAAMNCDWNYQVVQNVGGVVCVFTSARYKAFAESAKQEADAKKDADAIKGSGSDAPTAPAAPPTPPAAR